MPRGLGDGSYAVVARSADATHAAVIESVRTPRSGGVAIVTFGTGGNVRGRLAGLRKCPSCGVADRARTGSRLEVSTYVALLAADDLMAASKREAGPQVVEVFLPGGLRSNAVWGERRGETEHQ